MTAPGHRYCAPCKSKCRVAGCDKAAKQRGYCSRHDTRLYRKGDVGPAESYIASNNGQCMIVGCEGKVVCNSLCNMHYRRLLRTGELGPVERKRALVGSGIDAKGYRVLSIAGRQYKEHRLVMERKLDRPLKSSERVHHIDGDKLNNDPSNLEIWTHAHPSGQRLSDKIQAAVDLLREHPDGLALSGLRLVSLESQESTDLLTEEAFEMYRLSCLGVSGAF